MRYSRSLCTRYLLHSRSLWLVLGFGSQLAPREALGGHFSLFWALWPNVSQRDSGGLFWLVLRSVGQMASREVLGTHFGLFWALVANVSQKASEIHFG